jgi:hypothetical protein
MENPRAHQTTTTIRPSVCELDPAIARFAKRNITSLIQYQPFQTRQLPAGRHSRLRTSRAQFAFIPTLVMSFNVERSDRYHFGSHPVSRGFHLPGQILWLPWPRGRKADPKNDGTVLRGIYNHPVVVLYTESTEGNAVVLPVRAKVLGIAKAQ